MRTEVCCDRGLSFASVFRGGCDALLREASCFGFEVFVFPFIVDSLGVTGLSA